MPTYDYECQSCGHGFELFQSMTAKLKRKCPECGKLKLQRLIGPGAGFLFKGDGFYITDYRTDSYKSGEKAASDAGKAGDSSTSDTAGGRNSGSGDSAGASKKDSPPAKSKPNKPKGSKKKVDSGD